MYIIGIDGGGTSTEALLYHLENGECCRLTADASNPNQIGFKGSVSICYKLIQQLIDKENVSYHHIKSIGIGMSGLGRLSEQKKWMDIFKKQWSKHSYFPSIKLDHDAKTALYSGTNGKDGIAMISGTGSIAYGLCQSKEYRVGGWGHLIGSDRGSGYYIGYRALECVFRAYDTLGIETLLTQILLDDFEETDVPHLLKHIYRHPHPKKLIASLTKSVCQAAQRGDQIANEILTETSESIIQFGRKVYENLFEKTSYKVPFVLVGGLFQNRILYKRVKEKMMKNIANVQLIRPTNQPVYGALVLAQQTNL